VIHPGLDSHPQHDLALRQMKGFSGMIAVYIRGGLEEASKFLSALKVFTLAESLGGFESLAEHPAIMTHASVPKVIKTLKSYIFELFTQVFVLLGAK
jgi:cystathionine gamma-lyase